MSLQNAAARNAATGLHRGTLPRAAASVLGPMLVFMLTAGFGCCGGSGDSSETCGAESAPDPQLNCIGYNAERDCYEDVVLTPIREGAEWVCPPKSRDVLGVPDADASCLTPLPQTCSEDAPACVRFEEEASCVRRGPAAQCSAISGDDPSQEAYEWACREGTLAADDVSLTETPSCGECTGQYQSCKTLLLGDDGQECYPAALTPAACDYQSLEWFCAEGSEPPRLDVPTCG